jgi:hypothetical protein
MEETGELASIMLMSMNRRKAFEAAARDAFCGKRHAWWGAYESYVELAERSPGPFAGSAVRDRS